jgi:hypothetical protein
MLTPAPIIHRAWRTHDAAPLHRRSPDAIAEIVDEIAPPGCDRTILLGPIVEALPHGGLDLPPVYFLTVSADDEPFPCVIGARTRAEADELRAAVRLRLLRHRIRPEVHDFADELEMARWAERTWPVPAMTTLRRQVEAERRRN